MGWTLVSDRWSGGGRYLDDGARLPRALNLTAPEKKKHIYILLCVYVTETLILVILIFSRNSGLESYRGVLGSFEKFIAHDLK